jgi:hypothetical protein
MLADDRQPSWTPTGIVDIGPASSKYKRDVWLRKTTKLIRADSKVKPMCGRKPENVFALLDNGMGVFSSASSVTLD